MPLVAFHCPDNKLIWRKIYDCERCPDALERGCLRIETVRLIWQTEFEENEGHYHNDPKSISVTETMGCMRRAVYDRTVDYAVTPESLKARVWGTIIHKARETWNQDGHSEVYMSVDLGNGYTLDGTADRLTDDEVLDYKTMDNPRKTYDEDNAVQLSIYDEMAEECGLGPAGRKLLVLQDGRRAEKVHEVHRVSGALDAAKEFSSFLIGHLEGRTLPPPEGRNMKLKFTGQTICNWCPHKEECGGDEVE